MCSVEMGGQLHKQRQGLGVTCDIRRWDDHDEALAGLIIIPRFEEPGLLPPRVPCHLYGFRVVFLESGKCRMRGPDNLWVVRVAIDARGQAIDSGVKIQPTQHPKTLTLPASFTAECRGHIRARAGPRAPVT